MKPPLQSPLPKRPLFTLIEMISAIGIMALIISITVVGVRFAFYINSDKKSRAVFKQLEIAFDQYFADYHCYPPLPSNYKTAGYVPLGLVTWVTSTQIGQKFDSDGNPISTTYTKTGQSTVDWMFYTTTGQTYLTTGTNTIQGTGNLCTVSGVTFFRATLNHAPNNYNPYIEDALNSANANNYTMDGFGQTIYYRSKGLINTSAYDLWSAGADGYFGSPTSANAGEPLNVYGSDTTTPQVHIPGGDPDDYVNWRKN